VEAQLKKRHCLPRDATQVRMWECEEIKGELEEGDRIYMWWMSHIDGTWTNMGSRDPRRRFRTFLEKLCITSSILNTSTTTFGQGLSLQSLVFNYNCILYKSAQHQVMFQKVRKKGAHF
jgi:hypothetical protein